jgi:hypothetical protein
MASTSKNITNPEEKEAKDETKKEEKNVKEAKEEKEKFHDLSLGRENIVTIVSAVEKNKKFHEKLMEAHKILHKPGKELAFRTDERFHMGMKDLTTNEIQTILTADFKIMAFTSHVNKFIEFVWPWNIPGFKGTGYEEFKATVENLAKELSDANILKKVVTEGKVLPSYILSYFIDNKIFDSYYEFTDTSGPSIIFGLKNVEFNKTVFDLDSTPLTDIKKSEKKLPPEKK